MLAIKKLPSSWSPTTATNLPKGSLITLWTLKTSVFLIMIPAPTAFEPCSVRNTWSVLKTLLHFLNSLSEPSERVSCKRKISNLPFSNKLFILFNFTKFLEACPWMLNDPILRSKLVYCEPGLRALFKNVIMKCYDIRWLCNVMIKKD